MRIPLREAASIEKISHKIKYRQEDKDSTYYCRALIKEVVDIDKFFGIT